MTGHTNNDNQALFNQLKLRPRVAWPTIILLACCHSVIFSSWYFVLTDQMPLWLGCLLNCTAMYFLFSPVHDAIHNAVSTNHKLNEFIMRVILLPIVPFSNGRLLRVMHIQHHRFANEPERDPDHYTMVAPLAPLWIWWFWDINYLTFYLKNKEHFAKINVGTPIRDMIIAWALVIALSVSGYFWEMLFLWFIPVRWMAWSIALVFMYLPHYPHDVTHKDAPYQATHMRYGLSWLLTPLMAWQNYHLVHHLYPTVPFYRYKRIWDAKKEFHESHKPSTVAPLALNPDRSKQQPPSAPAEGSA